MHHHPLTHNTAAMSLHLRQQQDRSGNLNFGGEKGITRVSSSLGNQLVKYCQTINYGQRLVKQEEFNCKYSSFWISQQIWTIGLKIAY